MFGTYQWIDYLAQVFVENKIVIKSKKQLLFLLVEFKLINTLAERNITSTFRLVLRKPSKSLFLYGKASF